MTEDVNTWQAKLQKLEERLEKFSGDIAKGSRHDDAYEAGGRLAPAKLTKIITLAYNLLRDSEASQDPDLPEIIEKVGAFTDHAVNVARAASEMAFIPYLASFAHTKETLFSDPMKGVLGGEGFDFVAQFEAQILGTRPPPPRAIRRPGIAGLTPWMKELDQPHTQTTPLSRFRIQSRAPSAAFYPTANIVYQARCEITDALCCSPVRMALSSGGSCLALTASGGWKNRDPVLHFWLLDEGQDNEPTVINPTLVDIPQYHELDEARKLIFAGDSDRVKSYSWINGSGKPVHTLNSTQYPGPLAVLPDGRLLRAGVGSIASWTIDSLETYGPKKKRIGEGKYHGYARAWRVLEKDDKEFSTGSMPTSIIPLADSDFDVLNWCWHQPTQTMLCGENPPKRKNYACVSLDLEHGGKVATRYLGHGGCVTEFSVSEGDPHCFVTSSSDGYVRLFDMRRPLPVLTIDVERTQGPCLTAVFTHIDGVSAIFTGGTKTESIKLWDLRSQQTMYELSTGNNSVHSLVWNPRNTTLYAATECEYTDWLGAHHGYRPIVDMRSERKPDKAKDKDDSQEAKEDTHCTKNEEAAQNRRDFKYLMGSDSEESESEESEFEESESEDSDEDIYKDWDGRRCWPDRAYHKENFFGEIFDAGTHCLFRYKFKSDADPTIIPQYGDARLSEDEDACTTQ